MENNLNDEVENQSFQEYEIEPEQKNSKCILYVIIGLLVTIIILGAGFTYYLLTHDIHLVNDVDEPVACTMDAMMCEDGSYVGRTGPNCEFVCPDTVEEAESTDVSSDWQTYTNEEVEGTSEWQYSTTSSVPGGWQTLEFDEYGVEISVPDYYQGTNSGACDTLLPLSEDHFEGERDKNTCVGYQEIFNLYELSNFVTQDSVDSWGMEAVSEEEHNVNGRVVWTVQYTSAVGWGISKYINNPNTGASLSIKFTAGGGESPGLIDSSQETAKLNSVGEQILSTLIIK